MALEWLSAPRTASAENKGISPMNRVLICLSILAATVSGQSVHIINVPCCGFVDSISGTNITTIAPGTLVRWVRQQGNHTVTSGSGPSDPAAGVLFDGTINSGSTLFEFTFLAVGAYSYFCAPHFSNGMVGTVNVIPAAAVTTVGAGCQGSHGSAITLGANGLPTLGNSGFAVTISGAAPSSGGFLYGAIGPANPPIPVTPSCSLFLDLNSFLLLIQLGISPVGPITVTPQGTASIPFAVPSTPSWAGSRLDLQFAAVDAAAPGGFILSNGLGLTFGG